MTRFNESVHKIDKYMDHFIKMVSSPFMSAWIFVIVTLFVSYQSFRCFMVYMTYSKYIQDYNAAALRPTLITELLTSIIIVLIWIFLKHSRSSLFKSESKGLKRNYKIAYTMICVMASLSLTLCILLSLNYLNIVTTLTTSKNNNEMQYQAAIHEAGHCVVNEELFPKTSTDVHLFGDIPTNTVLHYLGNNFAEQLPGGLHRASVRQDYKSDILKRIQVSYGGMLAEQYYGKKHELSMGASGDLDNVKKNVISMVNNGLILVEGIPVQWDILTDEQRNKLFIEVTGPLFEQTKPIIIRNKEKIEALADVLYKEKEVKGKKLRDILNNNK